MDAYRDAGNIDLDVEDVYLADGTRLTEEKATELGLKMSRAAARRRERSSSSDKEEHRQRPS